MSLVGLIITIVLVGVLLWAIESFIPMAPPIKRLLEVVVVILIILWLLQAFGLLGAGVVRVG
jgi:hypothetical protein